MRIRRVLRETAETFTIELDAGHDHAFRPGQFNMLYVFGIGEVPISLSGDPARPRRIVHTTRAVGTVTRAMARLRKGSVLGVRGPYGRPWPLERALGRDVVLVAGGIGLAPLRPALYEIAAHRGNYGSVVLLYGSRSPEHVLFRRDLERWRTVAGIRVFVTVDHAVGAWDGHVGVVTALLARAPFDPANCLALVCGPEVMMRFAAAELGRQGVGADRIYLSLERNMKCALGFCGRCQYGPSFVCKDGPVLAYDRIRPLFWLREV